MLDWGERRAEEMMLMEGKRKQGEKAGEAG